MDQDLVHADAECFTERFAERCADEPRGHSGTECFTDGAAWRRLRHGGTERAWRHARAQRVTNGVGPVL
jgi:hypothetical protein